MLFDEEGMPHVEPPLLPEDQQLRYIVGDYRRISIENKRLNRKNIKLNEILHNLGGLQYAYSRIVCQQHNQISVLMKLMEQNGCEVPGDIRAYHLQISHMLDYYVQLRKKH